MNILIVDDDSGIRTILASLITRAKHQVATAVDGSSALQCVAEAKTPFDLIVTDHNMPGMSGSEFVRRLQEACQPVKVIVFSAPLSPEDERRYHDLDVKKMLTKPGGFKELVEILDALSKLSTEAQVFWLESGMAG
jgi:CheY-like chemotaxis protein